LLLATDHWFLAPDRLSPVPRKLEEEEWMEAHPVRAVLRVQEYLAQPLKEQRLLLHADLLFLHATPEQAVQCEAEVQRKFLRTVRVGKPLPRERAAERLFARAKQGVLALATLWHEPGLLADVTRVVARSALATKAEFSCFFSQRACVMYLQTVPTVPLMEVQLKRQLVIKNA
jgi:hypothetical protein